MPIKRTIYRTKFAIKALIISSIICLIPLVLSIVLQPFNVHYLIFALIVLFLNAGLNMYFTFFGRKNKLIFMISSGALFFIVTLLAVLSYLLQKQTNGYMLQITWGVAAVAFIYLFSEAFPGPSIYMRIWFPIIIVGASALYYLVILKDPNARMIAGTIIFAIIAILLLIAFIASLTRKAAHETLGEAKLIYDAETSDESDLSSRRSSTNFTKIPRIYDGNVYGLSRDCVNRLANAIIAYINECIDTINDMLDFAKGAITTVDDYNSFVDEYNGWIKNLNSDRKKMAEFLEKMADDRWLDIDDGRRIIYSFYDYSVKDEIIDDKTTFYIRVEGFNRTFSHNNGVFAGGKLKRTVSYDSPKLEIVNLGFHKAERDSEADTHGYHLPGTPMPEED